MKKSKFYLIILSFFLTFFSLFFYFDFKKNPIDYIILSKKLEIISYLFFRDLPLPNEPLENFYSINFERISDIEILNDDFSLHNESATITIPRDTYKTGIPQKLRIALDYYKTLNPNNINHQEIIKNIITDNDNYRGRFSYTISLFRDPIPDGKELQKRIKEYINLFSKKFMVQEITKYKNDEQCGKNNYQVIVVFESNPSKILEIALTNYGKICFIIDEDISFSDKYDVKFLKDKYKNYWL